MSFNSLYYVIFFLPLTLAAYYLTARKSTAAADWMLVLASVIFYGFTNAWYPVMLGLLLLLNWGITAMIRRGRTAEAAEGSPAAAGQKACAGDSPAQQHTPEPLFSSRTWMILGVAANAAILGIFKYTNFFIANMNALLQQDWNTVNLILPLGISFIIFSQISWIVDTWRGSTADVCLREYVVYSTFFPKLSQGPITLTRDFLPQLRRSERHTIQCENLSIGIQMFICGLAKKILIADVLGSAVECYYDMIQYTTTLDTVIITLAYTFQIYYDFSGYSDMAIGTARMLGFELPANFNSPYKACTVTDFWRRWHISLTTFLREYIYFPLGGSRKGTLRTYRNIMIVYLISGLWHGASWSYVLWGIFHGLAQCAERLLGKFYLKIWKPIRWAVTFVIVNLLWMLFRCGDWATFRRYWWHLTVDGYAILSTNLAACFRIPGLRMVCSLIGLPSGDGFVNALSIALMLAFCLFVCLCLPNNQKRTYHYNLLSLTASVALLAVCLLSMSSVSTFVYNDF